MRSEHSDEQSAEQLQEVDPVAGTTCASMSGVRVGSDRTIDGRGASRCRQSKAFGRLGAVNWLSWTPVVHAVIDLSLPKSPEAAILAPQSTRNRGMSVHTERDRPQLQQALQIGGPNFAQSCVMRHLPARASLRQRYPIFDGPWNPAEFTGFGLRTGELLEGV
jgi:hypothetical protein